MQELTKRAVEMEEGVVVVGFGGGGGCVGDGGGEVGTRNFAARWRIVRCWVMVVVMERRR